MGGCCATCCMSNACCKSCCCMPATTARPRLLGFGRGTNHRPRPDDGTEEKNRKEKKEKKMKKKVSPRSRRRRIFSFYSIVLDFSETIATATAQMQSTRPDSAVSPAPFANAHSSPSSSNHSPLAAAPPPSRAESTTPPPPPGETRVLLTNGQSAGEPSSPPSFFR
jgi:hypothetical protein